MNVYCTNCGKKAQEHTKFCKQCGYKLTTSIGIDNEINSLKEASHSLKNQNNFKNSICPECKSQVSVNAMSCPHCGEVLKEKKRGVFGQLFKWTFILFNVLMMALLYQAYVQASVDLSQTESRKAVQGVVLTTGMFILLFSVWAVGGLITGAFAYMSRPK